MHEVNIKSLDLNLLVALDALLKESSVTKAAQSVNLSQPAMSRALDRLRATLKDPLLVRSGRSMILTPRAEALRRPLEEALERIKAVMAPNAFVPAQSSARFRIIGVDYVSQLILPAVLERLYQEAPNIQVEISHLSADGLEDLKNGRIDLGIGVLNDGPVFDNAYAQPLLNDRFVCIMRKDHPLAARQDLNVNEFADASHALLSITGRGRGEIDRRLAKIGLKRKISLRLSHFLAITSVIERSDLITTIPWRLAQQFAGQAIVLRNLPPEIEGPDFTVSQIWHERYHNDAAQKWLRATIKDVCRLCPVLSLDHRAELEKISS